MQSLAFFTEASVEADGKWREARARKPRSWLPRERPGSRVVWKPSGETLAFSREEGCRRTSSWRRASSSRIGLRESSEPISCSCQ